MSSRLAIISHNYNEMKAALSPNPTQPSRAPLAVLLTAAALSAGLLLLRTNAGDTPQPSAPAIVLDTQARIDKLQAQLKTREGRAEEYAQLGWLLLERARENGDPALYTRAQSAFDASLKRDAAQVDALLGQGSLALSRHAFSTAIEYGRKALALNPYRAQALGVIGDGQIELGRYADATQTIQEMVDLRPDIASYSRVSYLRELHGDMPGAIDAMRRAVAAGNPGSEARAWAQVQLGILHFDQGDLSGAEREYNAVLAYKANYPPALSALARVRDAQNKPAEAIELYERVLQLLPAPEHAEALGDIHKRMGNHSEAAAQFDLARALYAFGESGGTDVTLERARFESDHGDATTAVTLARAAYASRPGIHSADALAWALYRNGSFDEAARFMREALRLNTQDAALHFHAGMIAAARGDTDAASAHLQHALDLNPSFDFLHAPRAAATLATLQGK